SPQRGHLKELGEFKYLREFRLDDTEGINVGDCVDVSLFQAGDLVNVTGVSKGKGFAGTVKRYGFAGGPKTHGQSDRHRAPGSIGAGTSPGRVFKGTRMSGHMGDERVTVSKLEVIKTDPEHNLLLVKGAVPGGKNGLLLIGKAGK
ncbi:MAG: 50S ribosomal protein L3, partial [Dehalococcoidales bacterium]|nr:50S ribosomal protein L3 [Dehalococcoidales bacterium]